MTQERQETSEREAPDPSPLVGLATAYWSSMVLLAANRLGVFERLEEGAATAAELARACDASPRGMAMLLSAAAGQDLVTRSGDRFANAPVAAAYLVPGRPGFLGRALEYSLDLYPAWGRLTQAVREGAPAQAPPEILGDDPEKTRHFVLAMHDRALGIARPLAAVLDLSGRRRLLDVGGGPGTYARLLVEANPGLTAAVLDLPPVVAIARELLAAAGVADRVETLEGSYHEVPFPPGFDAVLMSGMLHRETAAGCRSLLAKAAEALPAGGLLAVADVFFDDERKVSPPFAGLFALNMMLTSAEGGAHAVTEMAAWMTEAGFERIETRPLPPPMPHRVITGRKPASAERRNR